MAARNRDRDGLIVATVPEAQERLMCIQYPGMHQRYVPESQVHTHNVLISKVL